MHIHVCICTHEKESEHACVHTCKLEHAYAYTCVTLNRLDGHNTEKERWLGLRWPPFSPFPAAASVPHSRDSRHKLLHVDSLLCPTRAPAGIRGASRGCRKADGRRIPNKKTTIV